MSRTDIGILAAWPQCLNICNEKLSSLGVPNTNWPCSSRAYMALWTSPPSTTWHQHSLKFRQIPASSDYSNIKSEILSSVSFLAQFVSGIPCQPVWLKLPVWYPLNGAFQFVNVSYSTRPCKYTLMISLSYAVGDFVGPGTHREGSLVKGWRAKTHRPKLLILFGFLSTILLTFLSR